MAKASAPSRGPQESSGIGVAVGTAVAAWRNAAGAGEGVRGLNTPAEAFDPQPASPPNTATPATMSPATRRRLRMKTSQNRMFRTGSMLGCSSAPLIAAPL